jgi:hypothetical protein
MAKNFIVQFGSGAPSTYAGLSPTFTVFNVVPGGGATTAPGITQVPTSTGLYYFTYNPLGSVAFVIDGGASIIGDARYLAGSLDPIDAVDEQITALGVSTFAMGASLLAQGVSILAQGNSIAIFGGSLVAGLGGLGDSFGTTLTDPSTVFGYLKRLQEFNEGNSVFTKTTGIWGVFSRGNTYVLGPTTYPGSSTQIAAKTLDDSGSIIVKT